MASKKNSFFLLAFVVLFVLVFAIDSYCDDEVEWDVPGQASETIVVPVTEEELMLIVKKALAQVHAEATSLEKHVLDDNGAIFVARSESRALPVFARFVARRVPCGDCHDVFFVYVFNRDSILKFVPVHITKRYNKKWDEKDVEKIESRFVGNPLNATVPFNPFVDAITSATMSSKIVYYSMNETQTVFDRLLKKGIIKNCE